MAETTISDLYEKYTNQVGEALEDDRYFQYLFEMVQAGDNTLEQKNRILHKVIDEQWLTVVEEGIEAIFNIVDKPRRFIATQHTACFHRRDSFSREAAGCIRVGAGFAEHAASGSEWQERKMRG